MNTDRLLREVERRLEGLPELQRAEVIDAVREELARERRRLEPGTVEAERARRVEAESLRDVLEAINRQARLEETIGEVLKQLARIVSFDSCSIALLESDGRFRIFAVRGFPDPSSIVGITFQDELTDEIRRTRWPISLADVQADDRFVKIEGTAGIHSWAGIPLMVEGEVIGLLSLDRNRVEPFDEEDLHRARAVAFSAAAAIRKARLLEQVRRYAALMERVVAVDQAVFAGEPPAEVARRILEGAIRLGSYPAGLLILPGAGGPKIAAAVGEAFAESEGRAAPLELASEVATRIGADRAPGIGLAQGLPLPSESLYLVPLATSERHLGTLVLLDPNGETSDDQIMESYASRAATAYLHAVEMRV
jgi:GAF domain-containing protein